MDAARSAGVRALRISVTVVLALALAQVGTAQMGPGALDRPLDPDQRPFVLTGSLAPAVPAPGEVVEITAEIRSRVHPHVRAVVAYWIDGQKREEQSYVIAPFAESVLVHEWMAQPGDHTIRVDVLSPAGVLFTSWEQRVTIKG